MVGVATGSAHGGGPGVATGSAHGRGAGLPAVAQQPAREGAVGGQPVHEGGGEQGHHQLHAEDGLREQLQSVKAP